MFRGKGPFANFAKLTIISISFVLGAYGCGGISPTDQQNNGGGGGGSFLDPEMVPQFEQFLEFAIDKGSQLDLSGANSGNTQALKMDAVAGQQVDIPGFDFTDLQTILAGIPVRVNGSVDATQGDGNVIITIDLTFTFCFPPQLPTPPTTETAQFTVPEFPLPELQCGEGQSPITVHIVGELIVDPETGEVLGGSLNINDQDISPLALCDFLGENLAQLAQLTNLLSFCQAP